MNKFQEDKMEYGQYKRTIEELERAKQEAEKAWNQEWFKYAKWISAEDAIDRFNITLTLFYTMVAQHSVSIKHSDGKTLYFKRDIEKELKWRMNHEQSFYQI